VASSIGSSAAAAVRLPADHFAHPSAGIEWWYVSGVVQGADGHRYSVFFTLFRRSGFVIPVSQVLDLSTGALVGHSEVLAPARLGRSVLNVGVQGARLSYRPGSDAWHFTAATTGYRLDLTARPVKPYVLHGGGTGLIRQSTAGTSSYYSATRMSARGTITRDGRSIRFSGGAWLDHQWGSFQDDPAAFDWDWFSCRFTDKSELMIYRFRSPNGMPIARYSDGTFVAADGESRRVTSFSATPGVRALIAERRRWPLDWTLELPAQHLSLRLRSIVRDQLVRGTILPTFWEGASSVTGSKQGICFVEESYR
jgi:predicted secreted hydrolase